MNEATDSQEASPLDRARLAALEYFCRVYMDGSLEATPATLKDFVFEPRGLQGISASMRRASHKETIFWCALRLDVTDVTPRIRIEGHNERIDAIVLMLSYLAICNQCALDYFHPVLQQRIHAEPNGTLTLNG